MAEYVEKWGDSIESAVDLALKELKITKDEAVITVLEQPSSGFLGLFGRKLAKVRVERKPEGAQNSPEKGAGKSAAKGEKIEKSEKNEKSERREREEKRHPAKGRRELRPEQEDAGTVAEQAERQGAKGRDEEAAAVIDAEKNPSPAKEGREPGKKKHKSSQLHTKFTITAEDTDAVVADDSPAVKFIEEIAGNMGLNIDVKGFLKGDTLYVSLEGKDVGSMIGKRGQTLDAVQYLASIVQNKNCDSHVRVIINAEKYREKREKTLQLLAKRLADKCIKSGKSVRLEPMNPYERKVIHSALQSNPKVTTRSEGVEPNRRVVIELKR